MSFYFTGNTKHYHKPLIYYLDEYRMHTHKANRQFRKKKRKRELVKKKTKNPFSLLLSSIDKKIKDKSILHSKDNVERQNKLTMTRMNIRWQSSTLFVLLALGGLNFNRDSLSICLFAYEEKKRSFLHLKYAKVICFFFV